MGQMARAHKGFCHQNITICTSYETTAGTVEMVSCGCPAPTRIQIPHKLIAECAEKGLTPDQCAMQLHPPNPPGARTALVHAATSAARAGSIDAVPTGWE